MKSVPSDTLIEKLARQRVSVVDPRVGAVKGRVEARHLKRLRKRLLRRTDPGKVMRLVERRKRAQACKSGENSLVEHDGLAELGAAMHDPVADGGNRNIGNCRIEKGENGGERRRVVGDLLLAERLVDGSRACNVGLEPGHGAKPFDLAAHALLKIRTRLEQGEFDRGGTGIQGEDVAHYSAASAMYLLRTPPPERQSR